MPKKLFFIFLFTTFFLSGFLFLFEPKKAEAAADVCSQSIAAFVPSLTIGTNSLYYIPLPTDTDTSTTINFEWFLYTALPENDPPDNPGPYTTRIYWDLYDAYKGKSTKIYHGFATTKGGPEKYDRGWIIDYSGTMTLSGRHLADRTGALAKGQYGEHVLTLENPRRDLADNSETSLKDSLTCSKTLTVKLVADQNDLDEPGVSGTLADAFGSPTGTCDDVSLGFTSCPTIEGFVQGTLSLFLGLVGGISFLFLLYGGMRLVASQGDPKALQEARGVITAAISGLLFAIFSVFLLRLIGISVLGLPI